MSRRATPKANSTARRAAAPNTPPLCTNAHGFSLHAGVWCAADQRQALEHLCRYITRPAIANSCFPERAMTAWGRLPLFSNVRYRGI